MAEPLRGMDRVDACDGADDLMVILSQELAAKRNGEPVDEEALEFAMSALAAAQLVRAGMSEEAVIRQFTERDHEFHLAYDPASGELSIEVVWGDTR